MQTYLLSDETVRRYGADFINRLEMLGADIPKTWCTLGVSGDRFAEFLVKIRPGSIAIPARFVRLAADRTTGVVTPRQSTSSPSFGEEPVLLLDSAIHSGASMRASVAYLSRLGASNLLTYSLVMKKTTEFVPSFFGLVIDEHDRALFLLEEYPNNKLVGKVRFGSVRALRKEDMGMTPDHLDTGEGDLDKISYSDLWYDVQTHGAKVFVFEHAGIIKAFIHFKITAGEKLFIDAIATDLSMRGVGVGSQLMRWAETLARASKCKSIELWAISERVEWYAGHGYEATAQEPMQLGAKSYVRMRRKMLYNVDPLEIAG